MVITEHVRKNVILIARKQTAAEFVEITKVLLFLLSNRTNYTILYPNAYYYYSNEYSK